MDVEYPQRRSISRCGKFQRVRGSGRGWPGEWTRVAEKRPVAVYVGGTRGDVCGMWFAWGGGMPIVHLTARARAPLTPFVDHDGARWFWDVLRGAFDGALAAVLMPDHPHLLVRVADIEGARRRFVRALGSFSRYRGERRMWESAPPPVVVAGRQKLRRQVRYVVLNPCRRGLVTDPLRWSWSTHRDVMGAVADPWVRADGLARALFQRRASFRRRHHQYVSADPHVNVAGTPAPLPAPSRRAPTEPLFDVALAAASATRGRPHDIGRRGPTRLLFVQLARDQGWTDAAQLASICGITRRAVNHLLNCDTPELLDAGRLCLGDPRLRDPGELPQPGSSWTLRPHGAV